MAAPLGRGAQVRLNGDAQALARGIPGLTAEANASLKAKLERDGIAADGSTPDGSTVTGRAPLDELLTSGDLGGVALTIGTVAGTVAAGDDARILAGAAAATAAAAAQTAATEAKLLAQNAQTAAQTAATDAAENLLRRESNLQDLPDPAAARINLELGNAAVLNVGTGPGTVAAGDDPRFAVTGGSGVSVGNVTPSMDGTAAAGTANSAARSDHVHPTDTSRLASSAVSAFGGTLIDDADAATARATLGLGTAATSAASAFAAATHTHNASDINAGTLAVARIGSGTASAGRYVDGGTGAWTALPASGASVGSVTPSMDGTAAVGTATTAARSDHVHPSDTSRLAASAVSAFGLTLVDDADAATARATLGLGSAATSSASAFATLPDIAAAKVEALPQFEVVASATLPVSRSTHQGATIILSGAGATITFSAATQGNGFVFSLKNRTGAAWTVPAFTGATTEYARAAAHTTIVSGGDASFEVYTRNSTMYVSVLGDTA